MSENLTFNQVNQQESSAYMSGSKAKPSVLIERSDGRITVGNLDKDTQHVYFTEDGVDKAHPNVPLEKLSDQHQEVLAAKLAGVALRGGESVEVKSVEQMITEVEAAMDALQASMSEADRIPAWQYATALYPNESANARGKLSDQGKNQAAQYRDLYLQLKSLREQQAGAK
jgi:hypothetical protein